MKCDIANLMRNTLCVAVALLLAACGGGVGNSNPASPGNNHTAGTMTTAHRTSGVAPLAVFFDAVDAQDTFGATGHQLTWAWRSSVVQPRDRVGAHYTWSFGDAGAGSWRTTGLSKNTATGFVAAHVFENPGTYTVSLNVTQVDGTLNSYTQEVTVSAFSGSTRYIAATGSGAQDGTSADDAWGGADLNVAMAWITGGPSRRLLFHRGDTFFISAAYTFTSPGVQIGAYGSGDRPIWNVADLGFVRLLSPRGAGTDFVAQDIAFHSVVAGSLVSVFGPPDGTKGERALALRITADHFNDAVYWGESGTVVYDPHDLMFVVDSEITYGSAYQSAVGGRRLTLLGNTYSDTQNTTGDGHVLRVWSMHKGVISQSEMLRPGAQDHALKLHGTTYSDGRWETEWVAITDNRFAGGPISAGQPPQWIVSIGSQSNTAAESTYIRHLLFERNRIVAGAASDTWLQSEAHHAVYRNNVLDLTPVAGGQSDNTGFDLRRRSTYLPTPPEDVRVYGNTLWKGAAQGPWGSSAFLIEPEVASLRIRGNFVGVSSTSGYTLINGAPGAGFAADHNGLTADPRFNDAAHGNFHLAVGSPAIDTGVTLGEMCEDFDRIARTGIYELGAYVYVP